MNKKTPLGSNNLLLQTTWISIPKHTEIVCGSILLNSGIEKLSYDMRKAILMLVLKHKKLVETLCLHSIHQNWPGVSLDILGCCCL